MFKHLQDWIVKITYDKKFRSRKVLNIPKITKTYDKKFQPQKVSFIVCSVFCSSSTPCFRVSRLSKVGWGASLCRSQRRDA